MKPIRLCLLLLAIAACAKPVDPQAPTRGFRMGFSAQPPRLELPLVLRTIDTFAPRADVALVSIVIPWGALLADSSAPALVRRDVLPLANLFRGRGLAIVAQVDATDGLAREKEAPELVARGRSITEPAVRALYQEFVLAVDSIVHPRYLGLAMETNLVRATAPAPVYAALRTMAVEGAAALAARGSTARLYVSVQVETAWGRLPATGHWVGVEQDRADFPFVQALGLSSYPYLGGFAEPEQVPLDYYARLTAGAPLPMLVVEGGWSSATVGPVVSSPERQARWITRQAEIAERGGLVAVMQITFTDLDLTAFPVPPGSILPLFAHLGLVDTELRPKPSLAAWDAVFARPFRE